MAKFKNYSLTAKKVNFAAVGDEIDISYFNDTLADSPKTRTAITAAAALGGAMTGAATAQLGGAALAGGYGAWKGLNTPLASNEEAVKNLEKRLGENGDGKIEIVTSETTQRGRGRNAQRATTYHIHTENIDPLAEIYKRELIKGVTNPDVTGSSGKRLDAITDQFVQARNSVTDQTIKDQIDIAQRQMRQKALETLTPAEADNLVQSAVREAQQGNTAPIDELFTVINESGLDANNWVSKDRYGYYDNLIGALADNQQEIKKLKPKPAQLKSGSVISQVLEHRELKKASTTANQAARRARQGQVSYGQRGVVRRKAAQVGEQAAEGAKDSLKTFKFKSPKGIAAIGLGLGAAGLAAYNVWKQLSSTLEDKLDAIVDDSSSTRKCYYYKNSGKLGKEVWNKVLPTYESAVKDGYCASIPQDNSREWLAQSANDINIKTTPKYIALWIVYAPESSILNCKFKFYTKTQAAIPYRDDEGKRQVEKALESWDCVEVVCALQLNSQGQQELEDETVWRTNLILDNLYDSINTFKVIKVNPIVNFCNDNFLDGEIQEQVKNYGGKFVDNLNNDGKHSAHIVDNPVKKFGFNPNELRNAINNINQVAAQEYDGINLKQQVVSFK